jgi:hypothetical protein
MWPFPSAVQSTPKADDMVRNRDIIAGDSVSKSRTRWTRLLIFYLRGLAVICFIRGLTDWGHILGYLGAEDALELAPFSWQVTLVLYAVLNCVAAVGLWLTSAWGAVLWLIVTLCEVLLPWTSAKTVRDAGLGDIMLLGLATLYILLTWLSARERARDH